ncbi:Fe-Mn family superoxide dismutase [Niabella beijingensis]|uniref:Fe-Mn family superoxide dismutase n=1 Tax=Niabella beijingensis TaxID=2872700 RepID=UPI001CBF5AA6|nr:Fe-Mn family superoxide dismutase [Niabella beijingensis]MBZ4190536.1 twin-arginine translocation signal domain-containing protein [Niabella beijingensis]
MKSNFNRRQFIKNTGMAGLAAGIGLNWKQPHNLILKTGWVQEPLGYAYDALEPVIDAQTMEIHYTKHAAGYAKNLAEAAKEEGVQTSSTTVEEVLSRISKYSTKMRNNAGGHYNHELFWKILRKPSDSNLPAGKINEWIRRDFNSFEAFQKEFNTAATTRFGSGWAWLVALPDSKLKVVSTANQDNPLMDIAEIKGFPVLGLDVWEHAYYLKYQSRRPDYINAWWKLVNWDFVGTRFAQLKK